MVGLFWKPIDTQKEMSMKKLMLTAAFVTLALPAYAATTNHNGLPP